MNVINNIRRIYAFLLIPAVFLLPGGSGGVVSAAIPYPQISYGCYISNPVTMEGTLSNNYVLHNGDSASPNFSASKTDSEAHSGKYSFMINTGSSANGTGDACLFEMTGLRNSYSAIENNRVLFEGYIKGVPGSLADSGLRTYVTVLNGSDNAKDIVSSYTSPTFAFGNPDENGWRRFYAYMDFDSTPFTRFRYGLEYRLSKNTVGTQKIYIDDLSARYLPRSIAADDITAESSVIPLSDISLFGCDRLGNKKIIAASEFAGYSVVSGNAHISDGRLYISGESAAVRADYFGKSCTFSVNIKKNGITVNDTFFSDGFFGADVTNNSSLAKRVTVLGAIYDGNVLADIRRCSMTVLPRQSAGIRSAEFAAPFYVAEPEYKVFVTYSDTNVYSDNFSGYSSFGAADFAVGTKFIPIAAQGGSGWSKWIESGNTTVDVRESVTDGFCADGAKALFLKASGNGQAAARPFDYTDSSDASTFTSALPLCKSGSDSTGIAYTRLAFRMTQTGGASTGYSGAHFLADSNTYYAAHKSSIIFGVSGTRKTTAGDTVHVTQNGIETVTDEVVTYQDMPFVAFRENNRLRVVAINKDIRVMDGSASGYAKYIDWDISVSGTRLAWTATAVYPDGSTSVWSSHIDDEHVAYCNENAAVPLAFFRIGYDSTAAGKEAVGSYFTNVSVEFQNSLSASRR